MTCSFIWYELLTHDPDAALAFYGKVVGWQARDSGQPGMDYRILETGSTGIGGLMKIPADAREAGMRPHWYGYIRVADVDACVAKTIAAGGEPCMSATDIPGVGRIAMVRDPQGAAVYVMRPAGDGQSTGFAPGVPGHCGWHELHARDWKAALGFYRQEFGWHEVNAMDMGPLGTYLMFGYGSGDAVGGMFSDSRASRPHWLYYFNVEDIHAAHARVTAYGGTPSMDPHEVPGGLWMFHAQDPQGAPFALVGPKR